MGMTNSRDYAKIEVRNEVGMIKAIIFDMDGVLFDTENFYLKRRETFLAEKGISISHVDAKEFIGGRLEEVWRKFLAHYDLHFDVKELRAEYTTYKSQHKAPYADLIFPDVKEVLETLYRMNIQMGLASNSELSDIKLALESSGIASYFSVVLSGSDFTQAKPNPEIYNVACDKLGFDKAETLIIEDSEKGIAAGKAAEIDVMAIRDKIFGIDQSQADMIVEDLMDVLAYVKEERNNC